MLPINVKLGDMTRDTVTVENISGNFDEFTVKIETSGIVYNEVEINRSDLPLQERGLPSGTEVNVTVKVNLHPDQLCPSIDPQDLLTTVAQCTGKK